MNFSLFLFVCLEHKNKQTNNDVICGFFFAHCHQYICVLGIFLSAYKFSIVHKYMCVCVVSCICRVDWMQNIRFFFVCRLSFNVIVIHWMLVSQRNYSRIAFFMLPDMILVMIICWLMTVSCTISCTTSLIDRE